jgi:osmotically-inducible protein OsmY
MLRLQTVAMLLLMLLTACAATPSSRSTGERVDDAALLTRVKTALIASAEADGWDIDVEVFRGRVQLNGTAES